MTAGFDIIGWIWRWHPSHAFHFQLARLHDTKPLKYQVRGFSNQVTGFDSNCIPFPDLGGRMEDWNDGLAFLRALGIRSLVRL